MTYYKIIVDGSVVDAAFTFLRWDERLNRLLGCDPKDAHFIQSHDGNTVYRVGWLNPVPDAAKVRYETVDAEIVDKQEYDDLRAVLDSGETVPEPDDEELQPDVSDDTTEEEPDAEKPLTVQQMREKIAEQEASIAMLTECLLEMSEIVYGG